MIFNEVCTSNSQEQNGGKIVAKAKKLKIIPLGGLDEIGKNLTALEYGNEIIMVDCGMAFATILPPLFNFFRPLLQQ